MFRSRRSHPGRLASSFAAPYAVTILVTSRESGAVNFSEVSEARFFVVVRALGIVAFIFLSVLLTGLMTILVALIASLIAVIKDIVVIPEIV